MASGLPLVGTKVGGIPALIRDESTGLLVNPGDPVGLAAAIRRLIDDPELRSRLGLAARQRAEREFAWDVIAARTADMYERMLGRECLHRGEAA
jgi:glycosyltransferase involved in cell wall biosynthesis